MSTKTARCSACRICSNVSHQSKPKEVIFCPAVSQYRATAIFRSCDFFDPSVSTVKHISTHMPEAARTAA